MRTPEFARQRFEPQYSERELTVCNKEEEIRLTVGVVSVGLVPDDGSIYSSSTLRKTGFFSQLSLENSVVGRTLDPLQALYPNLEVVHIGLETSWTKKVNGVYPFALELNYDLRGAVILSCQGINPITGTPAIPKIAYEVIDSQGGIDQLIPNWIVLQKGQEKIFSFGCLQNPEGKADLVRQAILTTDRSLAIAAKEPPREQKINTLSLLFFERKYAWLKGELDTPSPPLTPDPLTSATDINCQYFIANAGRIEIPPFVYPEEYDKPKLFRADPSFLVRFHFLTYEEAQAVEKRIETAKYYSTVNR